MIDWDRLAEQHGRMVWRTAYRLLGSAEDAQDCLQETFLSALEISRRQRVENWPGLLRHLATARALDCLRQRTRQEERRERVADLTAASASHTNPVHMAEAAELASRLRDTLARLPTRQAEVFILRFLGDMSYREIADTLGLKENAVGVLLHEARERLRVLLNSTEPGGRKR